MLAVVGGIERPRSLTVVERVFVAVDELARGLDAIEHTVQKRDAALQRFVAHRIGRPGEGDDDFYGRQLRLDGLDPLGSSAAQHFGRVLPEGEFEVGWSMGLKLRDPRLRSPAVVAVLFCI